MEIQDFSQIDRIIFYFLPFFFKLIFLFLIFFIFYNRKIIIESFNEINKKTWTILFLILFMASLLRFFWIPHQHIDPDGGILWVNIAMTIQESNFFNECSFIIDGVCEKFSTSKDWFPGYPTILSIVFTFFEKTEKIAFKLSALIGVLSVFLIFLLSYLFTKKEDISLITCFIFGLIPPLLKYSGGVSLELFALFFLILTLIFFKIFIEKKETKLFILFLLSLLSLIYIRVENIFLIPIFLILFLFQIKFKNLLIKNEIILSCLLFSILLIPAIFLIYMSSVVWQFEGWSPSILETINYFLKHTFKNLNYFIDPNINSPLFLLLLTIGLIYSFLKEKRIFLISFLFFSFYFVIYSGFDWGSFYNERGERFSIILYLPLILFFMKGVEYCLSFFKKNIYKKKLIIIFLLIFLYNITLTLPYIFQKSIVLKTTKRDAIEILLSAEKIFSEDSYLIVPFVSHVRPLINKKNIIGVPYFIENNNYFEDKEKILFVNNSFYMLSATKKIDINFFHENYIIEPIEIIIDDNRQKGVYKIIRK